MKKKYRRKNPKLARGKNRRIMLWSKCAISDSKNSKQQDDSGLLSSLGRKTPLSKIPTVDSLLF